MSGDLSFQAASEIGQANEHGDLDKSNPSSYRFANITTAFRKDNMSKEPIALVVGGFNKHIVLKHSS